MNRALLMLVASITIMLIMVFANPAFARGGHTSCKAFGQNIAGLATTLGPAFGQTAAAGAPLNDTVDTEQAVLCEPK